MRVVRLYTHQYLAPDLKLELDTDIRHYALTVLRLNKRSTLQLFNGDGFDYPCEIIDCTKTIFRVNILEKIELRSESPLTTHLYLGMSKSLHMDYAIQKSVEAGVSCIYPILTERTVNKTTTKSAVNKLQHWQRIIHSACEQCGRAVIPKLSAISRFDEIERLNKNEYGVMLDANSEQTMQTLNIRKPSILKLLIGAEGGFSKNETKLALEKGYQTVRCGPRILRTETAALAAVITAQQIWGDLAL